MTIIERLSALARRERNSQSHGVGDLRGNQNALELEAIIKELEPKPMNWNEYFFGFAQHAARKSKDLSTKVGCVVVGPDRDIRATGYNGLPRGVVDQLDRMERPQKYLWTAHAEENAVAHAARAGVSLLGCTLYCTHQPCVRCTRQIIQAGINKVYYLGNQTVGRVDDEYVIANQMLKEAGIFTHRQGAAPMGGVAGPGRSPVALTDKGSPADLPPTFVYSKEADTISPESEVVPGKETIRHIGGGALDGLPEDEYPWD